MAKKKKKYKIAPKPSSKQIHLAYAKNKKGISEIYKSISIPEYSMSEILDINHSYIVDMSGYPANKNKIKTLTLNTALQWCNNFITNTQDMDQSLNISNTEPKPVFDTIDFTDFIKSNDLYKTVNDILNTEDFEYDPSYLFSPNQYFEIIFSENLIFRCKRIDYNQERKATEYQVIVYQKFSFKFDNDDYIDKWFPVFEMYTCASPSEYNTETKIIKPLMDTFLNNTESSQLKMLSFDANPTTVFAEKNNSLITAYCNRYGNTFRAMDTAILGADGIRSFMGYAKYNIKNLSKGDFNITNAALAECSITHLGIHNLNEPYMTNFGYEIKNRETLYNYKECCEFVEIATAVNYAIFYINKLLKDKKLSSLIKNPVHKVKRTIEINTDEDTAADIRQTRILGENICFKSSSRPKPQDVEHIIRYSTPEWGRREHLRKLKSGKIIKIKSSICKRHCIDNNTSEKEIKTKGIDYKIKSTGDEHA